jgi:hypothetical protein
MSFGVFGSRRDDSFQSRLGRAKEEGFLRGSSEGKLFKLAVGKAFDRQQALDWLDAVIEEGRSELADQHASEREVEAWDMCCRIAFLVELI